MDVVNWKVYSFAIPLKKGPVRKGFLLAVENGQTRWGEIAPYPGRSRETLNEAFEQLIRFLKGEHSLNLLPSVQCGLEGALCRLSLPQETSLYALLTGTPKEVIDQAKRAKAEGYTTVKLKISSFSIPEAQAVIRELLPTFRVRVDCNSAFSFEQAVELFSPFAPEDFDYIEDPTYETHKLPAFTHPFALDETVEQYKCYPPATHPQLKVLILKPTLLGGKKGCAPLVAYAKEHNLKVVFSPAFESGVGLLHILAIAKALGNEAELIGLDTHRHLEHDLLHPGFNFNSPKFCCAPFPGINPAYLTEVAHGTDPLPSL